MVAKTKVNYMAISRPDYNPLYVCGHLICWQWRYILTKPRYWDIYGNVYQGQHNEPYNFLHLTKQKLGTLNVLYFTLMLDHVYKKWPLCIYDTYFFIFISETYATFPAKISINLKGNKWIPQSSLCFVTGLNLQHALQHDWNPLLPQDHYQTTIQKANTC